MGSVTDSPDLKALVRTCRHANADFAFALTNPPVCAIIHPGPIGLIIVALLKGKNEG